MSDVCESFRELMLDALAVPLTAEKTEHLEQHVRGCDACRAYREALEADDRLLCAFTEAMQPAISGVETGVMDALRRQGSVPGFRKLPHLWGGRLRWVAAAVIVGGILVATGRLWLPLSTSTVSLAETLEAMRNVAWIHVVQRRSPDRGEAHEYWECFEAGIRARRMPGGKISYVNYGANVAYSYNPTANKVTVSFTMDSYGILPMWNPVEMLSKAIGRTEEADVEVTREAGVEDGRRVERIVVQDDGDPAVQSTVYVRDVARNVLIRMRASTTRNGRGEQLTTTFDYAEEGPKDIYALGVRADAAVFDIRPEGPALAVIDQVQERFERGFGNHLAVVLDSWVDEDGTRGPSGITVLRQQGNLKRSDIYYAFDFQGRPDAPETLYPRIKDDWQDLTIEQVLEAVDASALERRMLFDGRKTIRWRQDRGQMVRDEDETDQFKISPEPLTHSLNSLIWPNLHLRLQSGSSQLKREVRLLPEDPNRPGLVGVQFVGFAEREDYWFDPSKDHMRVERIKKEEGRGVVSRLLVAQTAQAPQGRWYPQVVRTEWSKADGITDGHRELRVLLDLDPTFGDDVFVSEAPTPSERPKPDVSTAEPESASQERDGALTADAESGDGPAGWVRDEQGRPIAEATVLLYHKKNRYGLGNRVVAQAQTGQQGGYVLAASTEFARNQKHTYAQDSYILIAIHPDYAFAWQNITPGQETRDYDLTLTAPTTRVITVTDHDDNPLPGARVWLYSAGDRKSHRPLFRDYLSLPTDIGVLGGTTDASGKVVVRNLPETKCSFHATLDGYATGLAFSGQNRIRLSPGANVAGWVLTDAGEPVSGAVVRFKTGWMWNYFLAESDEAGHFALVDLPAQGWDMGPWGKSEGASGAYTVSVRHSDYAAPQTPIELLPGQTIDDLVITVSTETAVVRCLVLEEGTDAPVAGARLSGSTETDSVDGYSDANGVFTIPVLPGPVSLRFYSPPDGVYTLPEEARGDYRVKFEARPGEMEVTLRAPPIAGRLVSVGGVVCDRGGLPVSNAVVYAGAGRFETATATAYVRPAGADVDGRFELKEVPAGRDLHVYAESEDRMLAWAGVFHIRPDVNEPQPLELVLQQTAAAAAVIQSDEGNPFAHTDLTLSPVVQGERIWPAERRGRTDQTGILRIDGIVPGLIYCLRDVRLEDPRRYPREERDKWLDREMTLIPVDQ